MKSGEYNLEDEEKYLRSYLRRTTAINSHKIDGDRVEDGNSDNENIDLPNDDKEFIGRRVYCCKTSRSLYCPECCKVLVPKEFWPRHFIRQQCNQRKQKQFGPSFPFQSMDIVLGVKERRTSSTGIQMMCISNMVADTVESSTNDTSCQDQYLRDSETEQIEKDIPPSSVAMYNQRLDVSNDGEWWKNIKLYDLNRGDVLPQYSANRNAGKMAGEKGDNLNFADDNDECSDGTYVLFPQEGKSVPISTVASKIKRLVVLDIKWTRSYNVQLFSADHHKIMVSLPSEGGGGKSYNPLSHLKDLPFVHLEHPPEKSQFWRWHNRGVGMLSTIEAIYFAAREVSVALQQTRDDGEDQNDHSVSNGQNKLCSEECNDDHSFVDILWLFALQRSIIQERSLQEGRPVAFSEEAKALARALRKQCPSEKT